MRLSEAFKMAVTAITSHKLRSLLTLIGIIAGVASIIGVMTGISVIQNTMEAEMSVLGSQVFQVQKWAAGGPISDEERRKIMKRRPTTVENADAIRENVKSVDLVGAELWDYQHIVKYRDKATNPNVIICGGTPEYAPNNTHYIGHGRNMTNDDLRMNRNVVVLGYAIAQTLFPWTDPLQKIVKVDGRKFQVIGVFESKKSAMGGNFDNYLLMPITVYKKVYGRYNSFGRENSVNITVRAKSPELVQEAIAETRAVMRRERGLKPNEDDDFTIFSNDSNIKTFNETTAGVKVGAFVVGIIALIVAGIGIMNIMLVSVTERTNEIGVRKSLGARKKDILRQFLIEAILLCNIGGIVGVAIGFGLGNILAMVTDFKVSIPMNWAVIGLLFCTTVGLIFGYWPARKASVLNPIESLRYE
ncbi:MAG: ABC transporter permease [Calditrichaceae bacterium]|jgi:putative ABC transport system permease protein